MQILPSGQEPATGLALAPFRGLRYAPERVSGLAEVTSPPYDVIPHAAADELLAADPHNVVRLILPRHLPGRPGDAFQDAARLLREWVSEGILRADGQPALYVYEQARRDGEVLQRGLIGALRLVPPSSPAVLPHEDVMPGPVTGRRQLMEATGANLEPIFLLYDGAGRDGAGSDEAGHYSAGSHAAGSAATRLARDVAARDAPLLTVDTADGMRHRLWAVTDPAEHAVVTADLAGRQALIADGHHRYAAYLDLQARRRAAGDGPGPWDYGLALLVDSAAFPPRIGPIHRVVHGLALPDALQWAKAAFTVRALPGGPRPGGAGVGRTGAGRAGVDGASMNRAMAALAEAASRGAAFLVVGDGEIHLLSDPDPVQVEAAMPGRSPHWRGLAAAVLQELLLGTLWGIRDDEQAVQIHHEAADAVAAADVPGAVAVLCPPMTAADIHQVAARGERVPRKSTSIGPKPRTGLVMRAFSES